MGKQAEEVLIGLLSTSYKLDEAGVTSLKEEDGSFKDDALEHLTKIDAERVATLRGEVDKVKTERYSQGKREAMEALEKELKDEFGIKDTDKRGKDLVKAIVAARVKATETLPDEKVKVHPLYLEIEEKLNAVPKTIEERIKEREEALRAEFKSEQNRALVQDQALAILESMTPILAKDATVARNQRSLLTNWLAGHKFEFLDKDGELLIFPMKKDGSGRLQDSHGHDIPFKALVETGARQFFEFQEGENKSGGPDPNKNGRSSHDGGGNGSLKLQTQADYAKAWKEIDDSADDFPTKSKRWAELLQAGRAAGVVS